jgi:hypothetical protein
MALWDPGAKTVPTTMSPISLGFNFVLSTKAYDWNQEYMRRLQG